MTQKVCFLVPDNNISGGNFVIYRHGHFLASQGWEVTIAFVSDRFGISPSSYPNFSLTTCRFSDVLEREFDTVLATWWETWFLLPRIRAKNYVYFVQSDERRFYDSDHYTRRDFVEATYRHPFASFVTEAMWISNMLHSEFGHQCRYAPNGVDADLFSALDRPPRPNDEVLRVLVEGPGGVPFKRVKLCFDILTDLPSNKFKVTYVSGDGVVENSWKTVASRIYKKLPLGEMPEVYRCNDVLLKLSAVEGFFGPPLEMMACGGTAVVSEVSGHEEYVVDGQNALTVPLDDKDLARRQLLRLQSDPSLLQRLSLNGLETAKKFSWEIQLPKFQNCLQESFEKRTSLTKSEWQKWRELALLKDVYDRANYASDRNDLTNRRIDKIYSIARMAVPKSAWNFLRRKL